MEYEFSSGLVLRYIGGMQVELVYISGKKVLLPAVARYIEPRGSTILVVDCRQHNYLATMNGKYLQGCRVVWFDDFLYIIDHRRGGSV